MPFPPKVKEEALVRSRRCCCLCHEFSGLYSNVHHIIQESKGGPNELENAIVLCLRCHGEVGHYNVQHPIGNKFSVEELRGHRNEWWKWCEANPSDPLPKAPISVSPGSINLGKEEWKAHALIKIYNKTDEVYYQIYLKITIDTPQILTSDIKVYLKRYQSISDMELAIGPITVSPDLFRLDGTDEAGNNAILLSLASMSPKTVYTFTFANKSTYMPLALEQPKAFITVCGFDREPGQVLQSEDSRKVAFSFKPPETFTVKSIGLLVKRS